LEVGADESGDLVGELVGNEDGFVVGDDVGWVEFEVGDVTRAGEGNVPAAVHIKHSTFE